MREAKNQYAPMPGVPALREALADKIELLYGRRYDPGTEITVSALSAQGMGGDLLMNINRWRGQVKLAELKSDELKSAIKPLKFGEIEGQYVELFGPADAAPRKAIAGAIVIHGENAWYFKLMGDATGVEQERERFNAFLKSVQFK